MASPDSPIHSVQIRLKFRDGTADKTESFATAERLDAVRRVAAAAMGISDKKVQLRFPLPQRIFSEDDMALSLSDVGIASSCVILCLSLVPAAPQHTTATAQTTHTRPHQQQPQNHDTHPETCWEKVNKFFQSFFHSMTYSTTAAPRTAAPRAPPRRTTRSWQRDAPDPEYYNGNSTAFLQ